MELFVITFCTILILLFFLSPGDSGLQKVFERHMKLSCCQIVAYKADPTCKWFALVGLYRDFDNDVSTMVMCSL